MIRLSWLAASIWSRAHQVGHRRVLGRHPEQADALDQEAGDVAARPSVCALVDDQMRQRDRQEQHEADGVGDDHRACAGRSGRRTRRPAGRGRSPAAADHQHAAERVVLRLVAVARARSPARSSPAGPASRRGWTAPWSTRAGGTPAREARRGSPRPRSRHCAAIAAPSSGRPGSALMTPPESSARPAARRRGGWPGLAPRTASGYRCQRYDRCLRRRAQPRSSCPACARGSSNSRSPSASSRRSLRAPGRAVRARTATARRTRRPRARGRGGQPHPDEPAVAGVGAARDEARGREPVQPAGHRPRRDVGLPVSSPAVSSNGSPRGAARTARRTRGPADRARRTPRRAARPARPASRLMRDITCNGSTSRSGRSRRQARTISSTSSGTSNAVISLDLKIYCLDVERTDVGVSGAMGSGGIRAVRRRARPAVLRPRGPRGR